MRQLSHLVPTSQSLGATFRLRPFQPAPPLVRRRYDGRLVRGIPPSAVSGALALECRTALERLGRLSGVCIAAPPQGGFSVTTLRRLHGWPGPAQYPRTAPVGVHATGVPDQTSRVPLMYALDQTRRVVSYAAVYGGWLAGYPRLLPPPWARCPDLAIDCQPTDNLLNSAPRGLG